MPQRRQNSKPQPKVQEITCGSCGVLKKSNEYYVSYNPIHTTGRIPYCKTCLKNMVVDTEGNIDINKVKSTLKLIDRPYIHHLWLISLEDKMDTFGAYMKNLGLKQNRELTWEDSIFEINEIDKDNKCNTKAMDFEITDELMEKWGYGYTPEEYRLFEKKWKKLIDNYGEKTALHVEGLITYIRFRVKEELATARGEVKEAKEWAAMAKDAATAAKINVSQLSKSDISGGVDLLPQLFEAVESEVGIIPILPKLKEQPYDDVDLIIWCVVNYIRRLEDKPRVSYRDIWYFYDEMLNEYYRQQGFSDEMIEIEKAKRNNIFRDLEEVYKEPIYEEGDN